LIVGSVLVSAHRPGLWELPDLVVVSTGGKIGLARVLLDNGVAARDTVTVDIDGNVWRLL
jgi:hypothetical protein